MRNAWTAISVLLFLLIAALWWRSYLVCDQYAWGTSERWISLWSARGGLVLTSLASPGANTRTATLGYQQNDPHVPEAVYAPDNGDPGVRHDPRFLGFRLRLSDGGVMTSTTTAPGATATATFTWRSGWLLRVPFWFLCLVALLPTLSRMVRARRRIMRARRHRCTSCAYDLTGNASGVCPECGMSVEVL